MENALIEIINDVVNAKEFIISEIPEVVSQLLAWNFTISLISFLTFIVLTVIAVKYEIKFFKSDLFKGFKSAIGEAAYLFSGFITFFIHVFIFGLLNADWLKIWIAPKLYLIEYVANLIK